jgi:hypothetical protein
MIKKEEYGDPGQSGSGKGKQPAEPNPKEKTWGETGRDILNGIKGAIETAQEIHETFREGKKLYEDVFGDRKNEPGSSRGHSAPIAPAPTTSAIIPTSRKRNRFVSPYGEAVITELPDEEPGAIVPSKRQRTDITYHTDPMAIDRSRILYDTHAMPRGQNTPRSTPRTAVRNVIGDGQAASHTPLIEYPTPRTALTNVIGDGHPDSPVPAASSTPAAPRKQIRKPLNFITSEENVAVPQTRARSQRPASRLAETRIAEQAKVLNRNSDDEGTPTTSPVPMRGVESPSDNYTLNKISSDSGIGGSHVGTRGVLNNDSPSKWNYLKSRPRASTSIITDDPNAAPGLSYDGDGRSGGSLGLGDMPLVTRGKPSKKNTGKETNSTGLGRCQKIRQQKNQDERLRSVS